MSLEKIINEKYFGELKDQILRHWDALYVADGMEKNDFYEKYLTGEEGSGNIMHPYVYLYELMKAEQKLILQYQEEIQKLN